MDPHTIWPLVEVRMRDYVGRTWDIPGLVEVTHTTPGTVGEWITGARPAKGEKLLRLWHYFAMVGYESPEIDELTSFSRYLGELLALSVITMGDVLTILQVKTPQTAMQIMRGQHAPDDPIMTWAQLVDMYDSELKSKQADLPRVELDRPPQVISPPKDIAREQTTPPPKPESPALGVDGAVEATLMTLLRTIRPLAEHVVSNAYSPEDRYDFREKMGAKELFEISTLVDQLCGERVRNSS